MYEPVSSKARLHTLRAKLEFYLYMENGLHVLDCVNYEPDEILSRIFIH